MITWFVNTVSVTGKKRKRIGQESNSICTIQLSEKTPYNLFHQLWQLRI